MSKIRAWQWMVAAVLCFGLAGMAHAANVTIAANGEVIGGSTTLSGYGPEKAFDGDLSDNGRWLAEQSTMPGYVTWQFTNGNVYVIEEYRLMGQGANTTQRSPKDFQLLGSHDGASWTTVDSVTNAATIPNNEWVTFTVDTPGPYEYYKFNVLAWGGTDTYGGLREIELHGEVGSLSAWSVPSVSNVMATTAEASAETGTALDEAKLLWDTTDKGTNNFADWTGNLSLGAPSAGATASGQMTGLDVDTWYTLRFYGEHGGETEWSPLVAFVTELTAAQAPAFNSTDATYDSVTLNWTDNASTESGYILQRSTNDVDYVLLAELAADTTSHIDTGVSASTTYYYQLAATNSANGSSTDFASCATNVTTAASPIYWAGLAASAITASGATLTAEMSGNDGNVTAYWTTNTVTDPATQVWGDSDGPAAESIGTVSRTASGLLAETQYNYAFYGTNSTDGVEAWSVVATFLTGLSAAQNPAFTAVETTSSGTLSVSFEWTDNASTETAYVLQRSSSGSAGPYDVVATLPSNSTSHVDYVMPSTTYYYRLFATNSVNATSTDPAACQSDAITTISAGYADGGNRFSIYKENGTNYVAHIFTEAGEFVPERELEVEYLIVGGGAGGGGSYNNRQAGGGGAGGLLTGTTNVTASPYSIVVGAGGLGSTTGDGGKGGDSSAFGLTREGGGVGAYAYNNGGNGGSGGGGGSQGFSGGTGSQGGDGAPGDRDGDVYGGGGGGANGNGFEGTGGAGHISSITGSSVTYAAGGAGGLKPASAINVPGTDADDYTGSGGSGAATSRGWNNDSRSPGGDGGSGVVVIRYQVPPSGTVLIVR